MRIFFVVLLSLLAQDARAAAGVVRGTFLYNEWNSPYCKSNQVPAVSCSDSNYLESQYHTNRPIKRALVRLERQGDHHVLGQGTTDSNGVVTISWWTLAWEGAPNAYLRIIFEEGGGLFRVTQDDGDEYGGNTGVFALTDGTTTQNPQTRLPVIFGSSSVMSTPANLYAAVEKTWDQIEHSSLVISRNAYGLTVKYDPAAGYAKSGYLLHTRVILIVPTQAHALGIVAHEMGHYIFNKAAELEPNELNADPLDFDYLGYPGHFYNEPEYRSVAFEEGFADFITTVTLYGDDATAPLICNGDEANVHYCETTELNDDAWNVETRTGACASDEGLWEISTARYLWDIIADNGDAMNLNFGDIIAILDSYPNGYANHQELEPWDSSGTLDFPHGRSGFDFEYNALNAWSGATNTSALRSDNCSP